MSSELKDECVIFGDDTRILKSTIDSTLSRIDQLIARGSQRADHGDAVKDFFRDIFQLPGQPQRGSPKLDYLYDISTDILIKFELAIRMDNGFRKIPDDVRNIASAYYVLDDVRFKIIGFPPDLSFNVRKCSFTIV